MTITKNPQKTHTALKTFKKLQANRKNLPFKTCYILLESARSLLDDFKISKNDFRWLITKNPLNTAETPQ
jgi:hypothetical protein